jgi:hypothetical protein
MVWVRVRVRVAGFVAVAFRIWTEFTVPTGKRGGHPRGVPLVKRMQELQVSRRGYKMASSRVTIWSKMRTHPLPPYGLTLTQQNPW